MKLLWKVIEISLGPLGQFHFSVIAFLNLVNRLSAETGVSTTPNYCISKALFLYLVQIGFRFSHISKGFLCDF